MGEIAAKILMAMLSKFLTETFVARVLVVGLRAAADKTGKQLPEDMVDAIADALGVVEKNRKKAA